MAKALYLTQDGITDHIGQAQIAPYILGLARAGHEIHVVSAEKPGRDELKAKYRKLFGDAGVRWSFVRYANRPPLVSSFWTLWRMDALARKVARAERPDLIHCRAYLPLESAVRLKKTFGAKLLVDFRDFWADVGIEMKPFKFVFRALKRREPLDPRRKRLARGERFGYGRRGRLHSCAGSCKNDRVLSNVMAVHLFSRCAPHRVSRLDRGARPFRPLFRSMRVRRAHRG